MGIRWLGLLVLLVAATLLIGGGLYFVRITPPAAPAAQTEPPTASSFSAAQSSGAGESSTAVLPESSLTSQASTTPVDNKTDTTRDISRIDLSVGSDATLLIQDIGGRRTGKDPETDGIVREISQSSYLEESITDSETGEPAGGTTHFIQIFQPTQGIYKIMLNGLQPGSYDLHLHVYRVDGSSEPPTDVNGEIAMGQQLKFQLDFESKDGAISTISALAN